MDEGRNLKMGEILLSLSREEICFMDVLGPRLLAFGLGWAVHVGFGGLFGAKKLCGMN